MLKRLDPSQSNPITEDAQELTHEPQSDSVDGAGAATESLEAENEEENEDEEDDEDEEGGWFDSDTKSFAISMLVHVAVLIGLASYTVVTQPDLITVFISSTPIADEPMPLDVVTDIAYSESESEEIGSNSIGLTDMALSSAPILAEVSELPDNPIEISIPNGQLAVSMDIQQAMGITESKTVVKGMTGVGETGTDGAVDRITYELLQAIEQRPTTVVWLFDSSISMVKRREEIRNRFEKIYDELGIVQQEKKKRSTGIDTSEPLLTSIVSFGKDVKYLTKLPTADLAEIRSAIDAIEIDESGVEMVFGAVKSAADKFKAMRVSRGPHDPERNVILITITDERGDDTNAAEEAIAICRKFGIQSHVMGVPAPFGREFTYIKFVDPDPKFDQTPDWRQVDQGPETLVPERVQLGYQDNYFEEPVIDSGFGPYALSRMCYETGGIYFSIHPNRKVGKKIEAGEVEAFASRMSYFFAPDVMEKYRPDYVTDTEYLSRIKKSPLREALVKAARLSRVGTLDKPKQVFIKRDEAIMIRELTLAQQESARLAPELTNMCALLAEGEKYRNKESSPRWLASFDLSYGTALAAKVRAEAYNAMLAKAKRGINFEKKESNTWNLRPSDSIGVDSKLEKEAKLAKELLQSVVENHPGTPWSLLASRELDHPMGWEWKESFTDLNPPARMNNRPPANNNPPPPARDEEARMLKPPPPKRPVTKI